MASDGTRKTEFWKIFFFFFYILIVNTDISGFTFQNPFKICKWVLESEIQNISVVENLQIPFGFSTWWSASGYIYIKDTNFCNYKFCSSRDLARFPLSGLQSYISNGVQNFMLQNLSFMFHPILFLQIFTTRGQPERGIIYM